MPAQMESPAPLWDGDGAMDCADVHDAVQDTKNRLQLQHSRGLLSLPHGVAADLGLRAVVYHVQRARELQGAPRRVALLTAQRILAQTEALMRGAV